MCPQILPLYGPFAINSFGLMIAIGIFIFTWLTLRDPRRVKLISEDNFIQGLLLATVTGFLGARLLFFITQWHAISSWLELFAFWQGGYSLVGGVIAVLIVIPLYLRMHRIHILALFDLVATYVPLLQSISRIGCFFAGCCYGMAAKTSFGIIMPYPSNPAYHDIALIPLQLYSAATLFILFCIMYTIARLLSLRNGQATMIYVLLMSSERFVEDFFRGDRELIWHTLSVSQLLALILIATSILGSIYLYFYSTRAPQR